MVHSLSFSQVTPPVGRATWKLLPRLFFTSRAVSPTSLRRPFRADGFTMTRSTAGAAMAEPSSAGVAGDEATSIWLATNVLLG
jgi:hypothetical protein